MHIVLSFIREEQAGPKWQALFQAKWPLYQPWFLSEGYLSRPGYLTSVTKLKDYMPELLPTYHKLVELAGGGDLAARFLSMYCPPAYISGCSQAVWNRTNPLLVRNYDYSPSLFEGVLLYTAWHRPVIAMSDCLWGVLDGINDAGLSVSLTFGGRRTVGTGFGIPLILRYILEFCETTEMASAVLHRIPVHMPYNVSVLDQYGSYITAYLAPDRPAQITDLPVGTNHQQEVEWADYARLTSTVERKRFLENRLADPNETSQRFIRHFLRPPLHNLQYEKAFGTLYTAVYDPQQREAAYHWPHQATLRQSFTDFKEDQIFITLSQARTSYKTRTIS